MTCKKNHSIDIKKIDENQKFSREIVLIYGTVKNPCDCKYIEFNGSLRQALYNGNFKILISLQRNSVNQLTVKYCETKLEIKLQHESSIDPIYYDIQPIYIITKDHDGCFQSDGFTSNSPDAACTKINLIMELAQCVISSKIYEAEGKEKSFKLQECEIFDSELSTEDALKMTQWELYDKVAKDLVLKFGDDVGKTRKFVGFLSCTKFLGLNESEAYNYLNIKNKTLANASLGNGFLALLGTGCFYALPNDVNNVVEAFQDKKAVDVKKLLDDSNYRGTYGGCFSTFLGSLIHELGHCFDLGHTNTGLMGTDIDHVHRFFLCQNFTEIMPKRIISNCQPIEKAENNLSNRITKIKKNGTYMEKYHEQKNNDLTNFEQNCLITLMTHKWFTQNNTIDCVTIQDRTVSSNNSELVLVEIRESKLKNSMLKKFWDLRDRQVKKFEIPADELQENVDVFAINCNSCFLKVSFK